MPNKPRTTYRNGDPIEWNFGRCDDCRIVHINGVLCHEIGCPSAWKDRAVSCRECGCDFYPTSQYNRTCDGCMEPMEYGAEYYDHGDDEDDEDDD